MLTYATQHFNLIIKLKMESESNSILKRKRVPKKVKKENGKEVRKRYSTEELRILAQWLADNPLNGDSKGVNNNKETLISYIRRMFMETGMYRNEMTDDSMKNVYKKIIDTYKKAVAWSEETGQGVLQDAGPESFEGILEQPAVFANIDEVSYKVIFIGKTGVGKTSIVSRFAGNFTLPSFVETAGIRITNIYWPVKIWDKIILFKLQCWDAGSNTSKKFSHIPSACQDKADLKVFVFSYNDSNSFHDLSQNINQFVSDDPNQPAFVVIGTRFSPKIDVPKSKVWDLESNFKIKVLNMPIHTNVGHNEVNKIAPLLNTICEQVWIRDQQYILKTGSMV